MRSGLRWKLSCRRQSGATSTYASACGSTRHSSTYSSEYFIFALVPSAGSQTDVQTTSRSAKSYPIDMVTCLYFWHCMRRDPLAHRKFISLLDAARESDKSRSVIGRAGQAYNRLCIALSAHIYKSIMRNCPHLSKRRCARPMEKQPFALMQNECSQNPRILSAKIVVI